MSSYVALQALVKNEVFIKLGQKFTVIIGGSPSTSARSPKLWNKAFYDLGRDIKMHPLDVEPENVPKLLRLLEHDVNFMGGAVTIPYKENVYRHLGDKIEKNSVGIGSVNCLYRCEDGLLWGTNTDGKAAVDVLKAKNILIDEKNILVLGFGGAGKAVSKFVSERVRGESDGLGVVIATRSPIIHDISTYKVEKTILWDEIDSIIHEVDVVINCTSVGFLKQINRSPLTVDQISKLKKTCVVYDIIYNPEETVLLKEAKKFGLYSLNGSEMNVDQAVLGFIRAMGLEDNEKQRMLIRQSMISALEYEKQ